MTIESGKVFRGYPEGEDPHGAYPSGSLGDGYYDDSPAPGPTPEQLKIIDDFRNGRISRVEAYRRLDEIADEA